MQHRSVGALSSCILALAGVLVPPAFAQEGAPPSIRSIRRIYVDKMDNDLDQNIRAEIQKKFHGDVMVVPKPEAADAILAGVSEHQSGTTGAVVK